MKIEHGLNSTRITPNPDSLLTCCLLLQGKQVAGVNLTFVPILHFVFIINGYFHI